MLKICHISDTHRDQIHTFSADILVHSGDYSFCAKRANDEVKVKELIELNKWFGTLKSKFPLGIIFIPGNHDWIFQDNEQLARELLSNAATLIDEELVIDGYKFYGTPSQPPFANWAFNHGSELRAHKYKNIPDDTDVLITHCPPYGILDQLDNYGSVPGESVGCPILKHRVDELSLKAHLFGHIHEGYGIHGQDGTIFSNASIMNSIYCPDNKPHIINI